MASNTVIQTNVLALNANRYLGQVGVKQTKASQKLSSGYKVNSAADDAAGLAISEKMRSQIRGLDMASKNSQDAISLIQTAEGGMQEIDNMVQRIRELVVYASNDTQDPNNGGTDPNNELSGVQAGDRQKIQDEINTLMKEIDSMAGRVEFNKKKLISGEFSEASTKLDTAALDKAVAGAVSDAVAEGMVDAGLDGRITDKSSDNLSDIADDDTSKLARANVKASDTLADLTTAQADAATAADTLSDTTSDQAIDQTAYNDASTVAGTASDNLAAAEATLNAAISAYGSTADTVPNILSDDVARFTDALSDMQKNFSDAAGASAGAGGVAAISDAVSDTGKLFSDATVKIASDYAIAAGAGSASDRDVALGRLSDTMATVITDLNTMSNSAGYLSDSRASDLIDDVPSDILNDQNVKDAFSDAKISISSFDPAAAGHVSDAQAAYDTALASDTAAQTALGTASDNLSDADSDVVVDTAAKTTADARVTAYQTRATDAATDAADALKIASDTALSDAKVSIESDITKQVTSDYMASADYTDAVAASTKSDAGGDALYFQVGANAGQGWTINIANVTCEGLGLATGAIEEDGVANSATGNIDKDNLINVNAMTGEGDVSALLDKIDAALTIVTTERSKLGAAQNRLEYTDNSLQITSENLSAAESRIRDTDMAKEMMKLTQSNILQQAATSMLAQANQAPQQVLQLLQ